MNSRDITREFNRRIFINQLKAERDAPKVRVSHALLFTMAGFCLAAWVYLGFSFLAFLVN